MSYIFGLPDFWRRCTISIYTGFTKLRSIVIIRNVNDDNERKPFQVVIQYIFMGRY